MDIFNAYSFPYTTEREFEYLFIQLKRTDALFLDFYLQAEKSNGLFLYLVWLLVMFCAHIIKLNQEQRQQKKNKILLSVMLHGHK